MTPFREVLVALWTAARSLRVCVFLWAVLTLVALPIAFAAGQVADGDAARWPIPTVLPADGDLFAALRLDLAGSLALAFALGVLFVGAILATVGTAGASVPLREFIARGASGFFANLRVVLVFVVVALVLGWGIDAADARLRGELLYQRSPGEVAFAALGLKIRWLHLLALWDLLRGLLFIGLLLVSKMAMASLVAGRRRSALVAGLAAFGSALRHPLRVLVAILMWTVIWIGGSLAFGELTVRLLEVRGNILLGALAGELGILFAIVGWVGFTLSARRIAEA